MATPLTARHGECTGGRSMRAKMHTALAAIALLAGTMSLLLPSVAAAGDDAFVDVRIRARAALSAHRQGVAHRSAVEIPLLIELESTSDAQAADRLAALRSAGALLAGRADGRPALRGRIVPARAIAGAVPALRALPGVRRVLLDGEPLPHVLPLDVTTELLHAPDVHRLRDTAGLPQTGEGIAICDVDSGIDVLHPMFFRADGGFFPWVDVDGDGELTPGVDQVDVGAGPVVIRFLDTVKADYAGSGTEGDDGIYQLGVDYLYADEDGSGAREQGAEAGFVETTPSYGERLFLADDVDGDGRLGLDERLVGLGTSKIRAYRRGALAYTRGVNLIQAPWDIDTNHGTGASGVLVGGVPGLTRLVGVAPGADLLMAQDLTGGGEYAMTEWCIDQGARVVLHEYAPWVGYHLDGSSPMEGLIDATSATGVSHINPAGNLSGAKKLAKLTIPAGETTDLQVELPAGYGIQYLGLSLLWRTPGRDLSFEIVGPDGDVLDTLSTTEAPQYTPFGDFEIGSQRWDSPRGTAMVQGYIYRTQSGSGGLPTGDYVVRVTDPGSTGDADVELFAYVQDEISGWGLGAHFPEHDSEDHLVGYPGTADHGFGIAAYVARGAIPQWGGPGERAAYSGRGSRIDGERGIWISGPADPFSAGRFEGVPVSLLQFGGTSGSSPHVAGAAALLLQSDPSMTGDQVRQRLVDTASVDDFTGDVPNDDFGFGKVDALRAITGEGPTAGAAPTIAAGTFEVGLGVDAEVELTLSDADEPATGLAVELDLAYDGTVDVEAVGPAVTVRFDAAGEHLARARVTDATGRTGSAVLRFITVEGLGEGGAAPSANAAGTGGGSWSGDPAEGDEDDGCGCRVVGAPAGGAARGGLALAAAAIALAAARRRRR